MKALFDLNGKVAIVTGGDGHLGRSITMALVSAGEVGMLTIYPTPLAPYGPSETGCSTMMEVISGVCMMDGTR